MIIEMCYMYYVWIERLNVVIRRYINTRKAYDMLLNAIYQVQACLIVLHALWICIEVTDCHYKDRPVWSFFSSTVTKCSLHGFDDAVVRMLWYAECIIMCSISHV
jgi:hypothetical protein